HMAFERGARAQRNHRRPMPGAGLDDGAHLLGAVREGHGVRRMDGVVGLVPAVLLAHRRPPLPAPAAGTRGWAAPRPCCSRTAAAVDRRSPRSARNSASSDSFALWPIAGAAVINCSVPKARVRPVTVEGRAGHLIPYNNTKPGARRQFLGG